MELQITPALRKVPHTSAVSSISSTPVTGTLRPVIHFIFPVASRQWMIQFPHSSLVWLLSSPAVCVGFMESSALLGLSSLSCPVLSSALMDGPQFKLGGFTSHPHILSWLSELRSGSAYLGPLLRVAHGCR